MTNLPHLLTHIEQSGGADREIDFLIHIACGKQLEPMPHETDRDAWLKEMVLAYDAYFPDDKGYGGDGESDGWPMTKVTASIDAALALVERKLPGWEWLVRTNFVADKFSTLPFFAHITSPEWHVTHNGPHGEAYAKTPALALCAALIRALIGMEERT